MAKAPNKADKNASTAAKGKTQDLNNMDVRPDYIGEEDVEAPVDDKEFFPKLKVMQALSPECTKGDEKYIPSASPGMLLITSGAPRLLDGDEGIEVVLLECNKRYVEYTPRTKGGGFVASYANREEMEAGFTKGNDMQTTIDYLCIEADTMDSDEPNLFIISLDTPSKMAVARTIKGYVETYKTLSGVRYKITAVMARNKKNQPYYNFKVETAGWLPKAEYNLVLEHHAANVQKFLPEGTSGTDNSEI